MQQVPETSAAEALAALRSRDDDLRRHLHAVRTHLAKCSELARELPEIERRLVAERERGGAYRADARDLEEKIQAARRARAQRARLRIDEANLMTEIENVRAALERRGIRHVPLPVLEDVSIASPCDVSWSDMAGDTDTRYCGKCEKYVHNLSMMSRPEAEAVLAAAAGGDLCVRLYRRTDGTVLTDDCPVGVRRRRFWRRTSGVAAAGLLVAALGALAYANLVCEVHVTGTSATSGGIGAPPP
jgi:hypothetical protein